MAKEKTEEETFTLTEEEVRTLRAALCGWYLRFPDSTNREGLIALDTKLSRGSYSFEERRRKAA